MVDREDRIMLMEDKDTIFQSNMDKDKKYMITITGRGDDVRIDCHKGESLQDAMTRQNIYVSAACGGRGTCGKCRVLLLQGEIDITSFDRKLFTEEELIQGLRLSCKAYPTTDCMIKLMTGDETDFEVVAPSVRLKNIKKTREDNYAVAIDIGTTTIAVSLIKVNNGDVLWTYTAVNKQRAYGFDVIARMQASVNGKKEELQECIRKDLLAGIYAVVDKTGIQKEWISAIAIAGNTTMGHLLMGYSCESLGKYPFTPVNIDTIVLQFKEMFGTDYLDVPVTLLPGISTYVGGDIAAGLLECEFDKAKAPSLFIDLGTNGEMAVGNKERILVSSTAAGPAFEGGNISCGVGSIAGAISNVTIQNDTLEYRTIGDRKPVGICGTGVIELVCELLRSGLVDETGLLEKKYFEEGYPVTEDEKGNRIVFTQKDIRELQLAKAAVRAGIEILIRRYGISCEEIDTVYLAGGFGYKINIEKAIDVGLLPRELSGKIKAIGNSSLAGAIKYLTQASTPERLKHILEVSKEINLSNDKDFNDLYVGSMYFNK